MRSLSDFLGGLPDWRFLNMPTGTALILSVAFGLSAGIGDIVERVAQLVMPNALSRVPAVVAQGGIAWLVENVGFVRNLLGADIADFVSAAALTSGINDAVRLSDLVRNGLDMVAALIPARAPVAIAATTTAPAPEATSGYPMGQATVAPGMDDIDLAVLSARGVPIS